MTTTETKRSPKVRPPMSRANTKVRLRAGWAAAAVLAAVVLATLAGPAAGAAGSTTPASSGRAFPGAVGSVAAISGSSMEVQNPETGQTTVDWTSATAFSRTATVSLSSVAKGDCVTVTGTPSTAKKSKAKKSSKVKATITAKTVAISTPSSSGTCSGFGGAPRGGGFRPPSGSGSPTGTFPRRGTFPGHGSGTHSGFTFRRTGFAGGKVTAVGTKTIAISGYSSATVTKPTKSKAKAKAKAKAKGTTDPKATTVHVKVTSSTTYTETEAASAANLADGDCVTAAGSAASNGTITASTIRITSIGGKSCTVGFGPGRFGGPGSATNVDA